MWKDIWPVYWKRIIGAGIGLFFGIIYLIVGFWDMLFVALLVGVGYWIGKEKEDASHPLAPLEQLWQTFLKLFRPYR
ncbi:MAG: DUF2273 domain-containing protein [Candidatus Pristimantibacillus lignocellulolyticus]|uniref:DUF2273 domain-containing protein n=1 Tax=Candidatus Pristimantibacillus lignocellulolyticus TaxID=2994561 RepID=A0A9J6ZED0_9BACL|nr:MAG: DUF2273 domain-containing protein [Candidatus Pristimantibacillus lignocellulolyticus]